MPLTHEGPCSNVFGDSREILFPTAQTRGFADILLTRVETAQGVVPLRTEASEEADIDADTSVAITADGMTEIRTSVCRKRPNMRVKVCFKYDRF